MTREESLQSQQTLRTINEYLMDMYKQGKLKRRTMETKDIKLPDKYQTPDWLFEKQEQPSLPSDLDEAAEKFARDDAARMWDIENKTEEEIVIAAFKAGAELMAGQGISMLGRVGIYGVDVESITKELREAGFNLGEEIVLQIRKKQ